VLVTSRRHLSALEDATAISLDTLAPEEAARLLVQLAGRRGLSPADPAVGEITQLCGYLPLAIGMVARQLHHHPAWSAAERAAELAAAVDRLELMATENLSVAAAFNLSYEDLTGDQQRLFRRLGLHPGTDIDGYAAAALDGTGLAAARRELEVLYDQYLLASLGDVRQLAGDLPGAARDLREALDIHRDLGHRPGQANALISLGELRRRAGDLPGATRDLHEALGVYRELGDRGGEAEALNEVGALHRASGDLAQAEGCHQQALGLARQIDSSWDEAQALAGLGRCALATGNTAEAAGRLRQALEIFQRIGAAEAAAVSAELQAITEARSAAQES
jgi:tetratricopeptide (TPR) repeat protein